LTSLSSGSLRDMLTTAFQFSQPFFPLQYSTPALCGPLPPVVRPVRSFPFIFLSRFFHFFFLDLCPPPRESFFFEAFPCGLPLSSHPFTSFFFSEVPPSFLFFFEGVFEQFATPLLRKICFLKSNPVGHILFLPFRMLLLIPISFGELPLPCILDLTCVGGNNPCPSAFSPHLSRPSLRILPSHWYVPLHSISYSFAFFSPRY